MKADRSNDTGRFSRPEVDRERSGKLHQSPFPLVLVSRWMKWFYSLKNG